MVRWVGFQPGWHVLDAGCGGGSFVPLLAELLGATGKISTLDLAPESIAALETRLRSQPLACAVETRVGSALSLPYPDQTFDAVWNANVQQYLTDDELRQMLAEFRRVTKPGGLVAVKDYVQETWHETFANLAMRRWVDAMCRGGSVEWIGVARAVELSRHIRLAGLQAVRQKYFGVEKDGPLNASDHAWRAAALAYYAECAKHLDLSGDDMAMWRRLADPQYASARLSNPDFHIRIDYIQVVGRVP